MKTKNPNQIREEAVNMIKLGTENVDMIIERINQILATEAASMPLRPIKIHKNDLIRPNKNWKKQSVDAVENALKAFEKDWKLTRNGKWEDDWFHVQFDEQPNKI